MEANWSFVIPNFPKNNNSQQIQDNSNRDHNLWTVSQNTVWNVEHSKIIWRSCFPDKVFMVWSLSSWWLCGGFTWIFHWFAWWHQCWPGINQPTCKHGCQTLHTAGWRDTNRYLSTNLWKVSQHQPRHKFPHLFDSVFRFLAKCFPPPNRCPASPFSSAKSNKALMKKKTFVVQISSLLKDVSSLVKNHFFFAVPTWGKM